MNSRLFALLSGSFLWIGFVCAISFMEAWIKFQAPGVTLSIGLGIGKLVFSALNKIEWTCALTLVLALFYKAHPPFISLRKYVAIPLLILIVQSIWFLPALTERAEGLIAGMNLAPSNIHMYYIAFEVVKVLSLTIFCIQLVKKINKGVIRGSSLTF
jgi:hypothetical protein